MSKEKTRADDERPAEQSGESGQRGKEQEMLTRVMGSTLALMSFAVVCASGLVQGNAFSSVIQWSLVALAVGGVAGILLAVVVRVVVTEQFHRQRAQEEQAAPSPPTTAEQAVRAGSKDNSGAEAPGDKPAEATASVGN